jgi:hypothetical protein
MESNENVVQIVEGEDNSECDESEEEKISIGDLLDVCLNEIHYPGDFSAGGSIGV